jgi:hypothetical protein
MVSCFAKAERAVWRRKLQAACAQPTYVDAKCSLPRLVRGLEVRNVSAARSLEEGLDETLTLQRLRVHQALGIGLSTTNLFESVMARVEAKTRRADLWRASDRILQWCAASRLHGHCGFARSTAAKS